MGRYSLINWDRVARLPTKHLLEELEEMVQYTTLEDDELGVRELTGCLRRAYFRRVYGEPITNFKPLIGYAVHKLFEDMLKKRGWAVEVPVVHDFGDWKLVGKADAVYVNPGEYRPKYVAEIKVVNELPTRHEVPISHKLQALAYAEMFGAKMAYLLYISQLTGHIRTIDLEPNGKVLERMHMIGNLYIRHLRDRTPPKPFPGPYCEHCPFRHMCHPQRLHKRKRNR